MEDIVKNEFMFYAKLAKPLILNLPKSKDRILAAGWIKKFMDENVGDEKLRTIYLKLLIFCLQRRKLVGIFSDDPQEYEVLEVLPQDMDLNELAKNLLDQERTERKEKIRLEMMGDMATFPAYTTDCSPDLTEYVAAQDIPNFGVHAFYAISKEPINKWQRSEKAILPKGTKSAIDTSVTRAAESYLESACVCAPKGAASAPEVEEAPADGDEPDCRKKKDKTPEKKRRRSKKMGSSPPTHPIGEVHKTAEERVTPTWGTNLLEVRETTDVGKIDEPTEEAVALEEQVSKLLEEEAEEDEEDDGNERDEIEAKAEGMMHIIDEWKQGKLDKSKGKKPPSRLAKLGDKSNVKVKSTKAPKIAVKGMKKGKGKGKGGYGPKPANLPDEFADWDEKDLEEAGLTWADLMPVDDDIDAELQRIEDEEMAGLDNEDIQIETPAWYDDLPDYDKMLAEAEAELEAHKTMYDTGVEEDEPTVEHLDDELEELDEEHNISMAAEDLHTGSPALTSGIPVTTPKRSPTPRRSKSPEKSFAEEEDVLLKHRLSPLRSPKEDPTKVQAPKPKAKPPSEPTNKDPNISEVFKRAKAAVDQSFLQQEEDEDGEFERLERQFAQQSPPRSPTRPAMSPQTPSPGAGQRVWQRAQQQEASLRTPPRAVDQGYLDFSRQYEDAQDPLGAEQAPCFPCSPPGLTELDELEFSRQYEDAQDSLGAEQPPCLPCSPPGMTEDEEFEMYESMYSPTKQASPQVYSPTTGTPLQIPQFNYGPDDVDSPNRFDYMQRTPPRTPEEIRRGQRMLGLRGPSPPPPSPPPPPPQVPQMPTQQEQQLQRAEAMTRAWEQKVRLRQGSPQANEIIQEAQANLEGDLTRRLRIGQDQQLGDSPPPAGVKTPPKKVELPPRPLFSPTTGEPLEVPAFNVAPEDLDASWDGEEPIPEFSPICVGDYLPGLTKEDLEERRRTYQTDIFERCGDPYQAAIDTAPRRPQYFPPGLDLGADYSPPHPPGTLEAHEVPDEFLDRNRPEMTRQSNICVGAKRREQTLRRQGVETRQLSPIQDEPYLEHLQELFAPNEYKGPVPQAQGLSPWRHEDVYYTPEQGDSTLEDLDWPLDNTPIRTPPCQLPEDRPFGYQTPFIPGVASPMTPPCQRPEERPERYQTPPPPSPLEKYWDPEQHIGLGLTDVEELEDVLPEESPQPCTPCDDRQMPGRPGRQRREPVPDMDGTPRRPFPMQMTSRQLFPEGDLPCDPCEAETPIQTPTRPPSPVRPPAPQRQIPTRLPQRGKIPSRIPSKGQIPSRLPSRGQIPSRVSSKGQISKTPRPAPAPCAVDQGPMTPRDQRTLPQQSARIPQRQPRVGVTPTGLGERRSRRLFEDETTKAPCAQMQAQPKPKRTPKVITPPRQPTPPPRQSPVPWYTPEGVAGPSRRPTGLTPPVYDSDFSPPPTPPRTPRFPMAKKIQKRSRRPPSPRTPEGEREPPSPFTPPARAPCRGVDQTPVQRFPSQMTGRQIFRQPGDWPREPEVLPPIEYSPFEPFVPDEDLYVSPPPPTPEILNKPLYFPPGLQDVGSPKSFPTCQDIRDGSCAAGSRRFREPVPRPYRHSAQPVMERIQEAPPERRIHDIPEYENDWVWEVDLFDRKDLDWTDHYLVPPSKQAQRREYDPAAYPPAPYRPRSPRPVRSAGAVRQPVEAPCIPCAGSEVDEEIPEESDQSGYGDYFAGIFQSNLELSPQNYPDPTGFQRGQPVIRPTSLEREIVADAQHLQRSEAMLAACQRGQLTEYIQQRDLEDIAAQADSLFDELPPEEDEFINYYPDVMTAATSLGRSVEQYGLPASPPPSPFLRSPYTPPAPCAAAQRTPPAQQPARAPSQTRRGPGGQGAVPKRREPPKPKQLKETKSSQLRKEQMAKKGKEKLSPTSRLMKQRKEKAAKAAEERKRKAAESRKAAEEAKQAKSKARVAERLPGGKMRPKDYRAARGTGEAPCLSAKKGMPGEPVDYQGDDARRQLFGRPQSLLPGRPGPSRPKPGGMIGKSKGRKGPALPTGAPCIPCGGEEEEDEYEAALREIGVTAEQAAAAFDMDFLDEMDEEGIVGGRGSPNAIEQLEANLREMDAYERQQEEFWRSMAGELDDDELRQIGITRAELTRSAPCKARQQASPPRKRELTQEQQNMLAQLQEIEDRVEQIDVQPQRSPVLTEMDLIEQAVIQREREEREYFEQMKMAEQEQQQQAQPRPKRTPKVITPPRQPTPPPRQSPVPCYTPEGVAGPSRRPTGLTPPVYDSDFSPPPTPPRTPRFPMAKKIKKRSRPPPPQESPVIDYDEIERAVLQREQEEREYFEQMQSQAPCQRQPTEEEEQMEFEELERQMAMEGQGCSQLCSGATGAEPLLGIDEAGQQQESIRRQRLFEQQLELQGPPMSGRQYPAAGIAYSPPRPKGPFGPAPYEQQAGFLPAQTPPHMDVWPQVKYPTPRQQGTPCPHSPGIPSPPSPIPSPPAFLDDIEPPFFEDADEEARLADAPAPCIPCGPPTPPPWIPSPSPPRPPSPPPFIPTPPSPPLIPTELREQVASMSRPEFDPVRRRDILPRDARRAFRAPGVGLYNVQEEEPLIPCLAGDESYMGYQPRYGERPPKRKKKFYKDIKAQRLFDKSETGKYLRKLEKRYDLPDLPPCAQSSPGEPDYILDDSLPENLPGPLLPQSPTRSPLRMRPTEPVPFPPWEEEGRPCVPCLPQGVPEFTEFYQGGGPVHPDLADLVGYQPPLQIPEDIEDLGGVEMGEDLFYTPERYPEIDERELDREAALAYQPPDIVKNIWLTSPQDMGILTPPSCGRGPVGTYTPTATPPLQILDSPLLQDMEDAMGGPDVQEFLVTTPPLEKDAYLQELKYRTHYAKGREGIKPRPLFFGGYGETPQRPVPRWYGRGGAVNAIREVEEPFSPPTPGTPPPQLPEPCPPCSPEMTEFEELERQMAEEEGGRKSRRHRRRRDLEETQRQMRIDELSEQAERREMERRRAPPPSLPRAPSPRRIPSPRAPSPPRIPTPPPLPPGSPARRSPCGTPPITTDRRELEQFMFDEMGVDPSAIPELVPPGTPTFFDEGMDDVFQGYESPPPLSPQAAGPCNVCTPPAPPSPPPPPGSPLAPQQSQLQMYIAQMQREEQAKQEREARRQQMYQSNMEDIRQTFGPSPGPPSPGPDQDFFANVYGHQVSDSFRQGERPRTAVREQLGRREFMMNIPRHTPGPDMPSITEPRVRINVPEQSRGRPAPRPRAATAGGRPTAAAAATTRPTPQLDRQASAQRIADARKHYQQMGRKKKEVPPCGARKPGACPSGPPQPCPQEQQLNLQPVEDFLRQGDQQGPAEEPCPGTRPALTAKEAQTRAKERLRARKQAPCATRTPRPGPPPPAPPPAPQPFTGFIPPQVQRNLPRPPPQPQVPRAGSSRTGMQAQPGPSRTQIRRPASTSRQPQPGPQQGGGCGGSGRPCGGGRPGPSASSTRMAPGSSRQARQPQPRPDLTGAGTGTSQAEEQPRRVVTKTSAVKKIVTRQNK